MEMKSKSPYHQYLKDKALKNPEVKKKYERLKPVLEKHKDNLKRRN